MGKAMPMVTENSALMLIALHHTTVTCKAYNQVRENKKGSFGNWHWITERHGSIAA